jgi:hypothetical protein
MTVINSALKSSLGSGTFNELSSLIPIRLRHQSEEEASSVRVAHTRSTLTRAGDTDSASAPILDPHNLKAATLQDSERWKLLKKINETIKASGNTSQVSTG